MVELRILKLRSLLFPLDSDIKLFYSIFIFIFILSLLVVDFISPLELFLFILLHILLVENFPYLRRW